MLSELLHCRHVFSKPFFVIVKRPFGLVPYLFQIISVHFKILLKSFCTDAKSRCQMHDSNCKRAVSFNVWMFSRFTSRVRILNMEYADSEELSAIYTAYLTPILHHRPTLQRHPVWGSPSRIQQLASSMVQV